LYMGTIETLSSSHFAINAYIDYIQIPTVSGCYAVIINIKLYVNTV